MPGPRCAFDFDHLARGPGYWHFNNELLKDEVFEAEIEGFWTDWKTRFKDFPNALKGWNRAKQHFKIIAIRQAKIRKKAQWHERHQLETELERLKRKAKNGSNCDIE